MTLNMTEELMSLEERCTHRDTMVFTQDDAERLDYLRLVLELFQAERKAITGESK